MKMKVDYVKKLIKLREKNGWTQYDIAREFKVSRPSVTMWESGERKMSGAIERLIELYEEYDIGAKEK